MHGMKIDPRMLKQAMKQMKIDMEELKAEQVIIRMPERDLIFISPQVMVMSAPGMKTYQITGNPKEIARVAVKEEDVALVREQTGVSDAEAREALKKSGGDLAAAIMSLKGGEG